MPEQVAPQCQCRLFTFKEGMLSALAHDLEIEVTRWSIRWDGEPVTTIEASFDTTSLRVLHALRDGKPTSALSSQHKRDIEDSITHEVLHSLKYPTTTFRSTTIVPNDVGYRVSGLLTIAGVQRPISFDAKRRDGRYEARVSLRMRDFGIKPYSAMLGTLRVKAEMEVALSVLGEA